MNAARRELLLSLAIAAALVFARSAVFIVYEHAFFDSDQAIVGLMAKHLIEGRAFPLFCYGLNYMLGVDAWVTAPVFAIAGASVATLHIAMALFNVLAGALLILAFRRSGLRPLLAVVAASFFLFAPPFTAANLIEAGANIGPIVYVVALWLLRHRPIAFGATLALGFLHREFTIYAVPVLLAADLFSRRLVTGTRIRFWSVAVASTLVVWLGIQALRPMADMMGPGTRGRLVTGSAESQFGNIADRVALVPSDLFHRAAVFVPEQLPRLFGTIHLPDPIGPQGRDWMFWPFIFFMAASLGRAVYLGITNRTGGRAAFSFYLFGVGVISAIAVVATRPVDMIVDRYFLLAIFLPIGAVGAHLTLEPRVVARWASVGAIAVWMAISAQDHWRQVVRYAYVGEGNELRDLVDGMLARHIRIAEAGYWRAYKITFLSHERIKVASTEGIRIDEYQKLAAAAGPRLVTLQEEPCGTAEKISLWYLCRHDR